MRKGQETAHASPADARLDLLLWIALLLGPLAMGVNTIVGYTVAHWVCDVNHKTTAFLVSGIDLLLCVVALVMNTTFRSRFSAADDTAPATGRRFFTARMALLLSALSTMVVIAQTLAVLTLHPCD
jgi:ABC-type sulfate transport system permease subunit